MVVVVAAVVLDNNRVDLVTNVETNDRNDAKSSRLREMLLNCDDFVVLVGLLVNFAIIELK